jgi:hypothetical protein
MALDRFGPVFLCFPASDRCINIPNLSANASQIDFSSQLKLSSIPCWGFDMTHHLAKLTAQPNLTIKNICLLGPYIYLGKNLIYIHNTLSRNQGFFIWIPFAYLV